MGNLGMLWAERLQWISEMKRSLVGANSLVTEQRKARTNGHQGCWSSTTNLFSIWCDQSLSIHTHTHAVNKHVMFRRQTYGHSHTMDMLFIAFSALVSYFCAVTGCLLMTGFMDYGKSSCSTAVLACSLLTVVASGFDLLCWFFKWILFCHFRSFRVQKISGPNSEIMFRQFITSITKC